MKTYFLNVARVFVVVACFILDVKVHAESKWLSVIKSSGTFDMDDLGEAVDVETFKAANLIAQVDEQRVSLTGASFATFRKESVTLHRGILFIDSSGENFKLKSRHLDVIASANAQLFIEAYKSKTYVSVLKGNVLVHDRLGGERSLKAGYKIWYGGLTSEGTKASGGLEPIDLEKGNAMLTNFGQINSSELNVALDHLRTHWMAAVEDVAAKNQEEVLNSMKLYDNWKQEKQKRKLASLKEKYELKKRFRAHALDLPYENQ